MITSNTSFGVVLAEHILQICKDVNPKCYGEVCDSIAKANSVFLVGAGRSRLALEFFAMRLMHLGVDAHMVGDVSTPAAKAGDLIIAVSNSGTTEFPLKVFQKAQKLECNRLLITNTNSLTSPMAQIADLLVPITINQDEIKAFLVEEGETLAPMGTLFELSCLMFCEGVIAKIIFDKSVHESDMKQLHANLE